MSAIVSMWSGPRNISTTMMRSFGARSDTTCLDEPFYGWFLARTSADHPYREETLAAYPHDWNGVTNWIERASAETPILFLKHIAYHLEDDAEFDFMLAHRNILLIRDPRRMVASFSNKYDDVAPIVRSYALERRMLEFLDANRLPAVVVDAADMLREPAPMLRALCKALEIPYTSEMLAWHSGPHPEDGPWGPHWYDAVNASHGFRPVEEKPVTLTPDLEEIAQAAMDDYLALHRRRLLV